jgi:hypothetical protein
MTETSSGEHVGIAIEGDNKRHFQMSIVWPVVGIAWGTMAYSYAGSIIGTTLGEYAGMLMKHLIFLLTLLRSALIL